MGLNVVPFPASNVNDVAAMAREFADKVDRGEFGEVSATVMVIDSADSLFVEHWGENQSFHQAIGILATGQHYLLNQILPPDID